MRGNNAIPVGHFHKDWQRYVKTWFDQPAQKKERRNRRIAKAKRIHPRPLNSLRPVVRCQTIRYNTRVRAGRGFTIDELRAAKISPSEAPGIGITVDHRRKNRSEEAFQQNVERLKLYRSKLVLFPRKSTSQRVKKGDATPAERKAVQQVVASQPIPLRARSTRAKARVISKVERERTVSAVLRKALTDSKLWGQREKRAKEKAEKAAAGGKKAEKAGAAEDDE